jgi:hypothetical protein
VTPCTDTGCLHINGISLTFVAEHVQLLKPIDLRRYVDALLAVKNEIVLDPSRIAAVHNTQLGVAHSKGRKDSQ